MLNAESEEFEFDRAEFELQVYDLLNTFLGSKALAEFRKCEIEGAKNSITERKHNEPLARLQRDHFRMNVSHLILSIAGLLRVVEERDRDGIVANDFICGELREPVDDKAKGLGLREACNKIIHAKSIVIPENVVASERPAARQKYFEPKLVLTGSRGRVKWQAEIDVIKFCRGSLYLYNY